MEYSIQYCTKGLNAEEAEEIVDYIIKGNAENIFYSIIGPHAGESAKEIIQRKIEEMETFNLDYSTY